MFKYILLVYLVLINLLLAEPLQIQSGVNKKVLIELYTSEGCSSCPPAEKFLNNLKLEKNLWKKHIPIAFHVDYWDYIGWKDPYAQSIFGQRQSLYAKINKMRTVYTPAFIINGKSWRRGLFFSNLPEESSITGNLKLTIDNKSIKANYNPVSARGKPLKLNVALLGMNLVSKIKRGENAGRTAKHEFVVVGFKSVESKNLRWKLQLPEMHYKKSKKYAIAAWVSSINDPSPLQVVGGELPNYRP